MIAAQAQPPAFDRLENRTRLTGKLVVLTGLRIGAGGDTGVSGSRLPVMRDSFDRPFIPGASFKGVLRATLESLVRGLSTDGKVQQQKLACMVLTSSERCITDTEIAAWRRDQQANSPADLSRQVHASSCLICQMFGSPWLASRIAVRDLMVDRAVWFGQFEVRQGVAILRDTETAATNLLYDFEVVPAETRFDLEIEADNLADWQKGLLWLGIQRFLAGEISLGGGRSRGLGRVGLEKLTWSGWELGTDRVASVLALLTAPWQTIAAEKMPQTWRDALEARLKEAIGVQPTAERGATGADDQPGGADSD
jgi:CRISPR-associated RAMP protein (TIGR02581 family)